jgi:hypothetical protein
MAKKRIPIESRLDELKRFGAMHGVEVMERELNSYTDFLDLVADKNNSGWILSADSEFVLYGPNELSLIKTWFGHDEKVTYPIFIPCPECKFYERCKGIWDDCGKSECNGCEEYDECDGNMDCRKTGGEWKVTNPVEWVWDGLREQLTKENILDVYFKLLRAESFEYGAFIDLSDADAVQSYAEDFSDHPYRVKQ